MIIEHANPGTTSDGKLATRWAEILVSAIASASHWLLDCLRRAEQRRALAELDDRLLRDVGLSSAEAGRETAKPFWQGPNHQ